MSILLREAVGAAMLLLLFVAVLTVAEVLTRKRWLAAETSRKFVHLTGGLGFLLFPFVITSWITALCLVCLFSAILYLGETHRLLVSLCSVSRKSHGSLLFPLAVMILFVLGRDRMWLYVSGLLVLVLADTAAALTGTRFGRILFRTGPDESKSLEGTLAFWLVGCLAVYLPLLLLSDIPHLTCGLTAVLMALLLAGLEAVSIGGTDNIFVPVATSFLLLKVPTKPPAEILFQAVSFVGVAYVVWRINNRHKILQVRPLIIFALASYATWALGSADWMLPLLAGFVIYARICTDCSPLPADLTACELLRPMAASIIILFAANATLALDFWFAPFVVATAVSVSLCIANRRRVEPTPQKLNGMRLVATAVLPSALPLLICIPIQGWQALSASPVLVSFCAAVTVIYNRFACVSVTPFAWNYAIPMLSTGTALTYAGLQYIGLLPLMAPSTWLEVFRCQ